MNESLLVQEGNFSLKEDVLDFILLNLIFLYSPSYARISLSAYMSMISMFIIAPIKCEQKFWKCIMLHLFEEF